MAIPFTYHLSLWSLACLFINLELGVDGQQYFEVYGKPGCNPICCAKNINRNLTESGEVGVVAQHTYYVRANGLWGLRHCNNATQSECLGNEVWSGKSPIIDCLPVESFPNKTTWIVTRYGPSNQNENKFIGYHQPNFEGAQVEVAPPGSSSIDMIIRSFYFFGDWCWELFPEANYVGEPTVLNYSPGEPKTFNVSTSLPVGSIRQGCSPGIDSTYQTTVSSTVSGCTPCESSTPSPSTIHSFPTTESNGGAYTGGLVNFVFIPVLQVIAYFIKLQVGL